MYNKKKEKEGKEKLIQCINGILLSLLLFSNGVGSHVQSGPEDNHNKTSSNINSIQSVEQEEEQCQETEDGEESNTDKFHPIQSISSRTSTLTRNTGSFATANTNPTYGATDDNEIDYKILGQPLPRLIDSDPASSSASVRTIRPRNKKFGNEFTGEQSIQNDTTISSSSKPPPPPSSSSSSATQQQQLSQQEEEEQQQRLTPSRNETQTPLYWKSSGAIFMPPAAQASFIAREQRYLGNNDNEQEENIILKRDTLLCKKSLGAHGLNSQPTQYKASKEGKNQKEEWRQLQVELTSKTLSLYSSPVKKKKKII